LSDPVRVHESSSTDDLPILRTATARVKPAPAAEPVPHKGMTAALQSGGMTCATVNVQPSRRKSVVDVVELAGLEPATFWVR
jgi:hypothetical protein